MANALICAFKLKRLWNPGNYKETMCGRGKILRQGQSVALKIRRGKMNNKEGGLRGGGVGGEGRGWTGRR